MNVMVFLCSQAPSCLMVQMPRFGNKYKMFSHIIPSTELDVTDVLHNCELAKTIYTSHNVDSKSVSSISGCV